ncbi:nitroreductase/quinone reductase family protein [Dactylosporangium salmoneum]|uniref:Nitroreductase family deazaflavin-dependent oxidoreductase n=1 Tax=Dactylosporangium salmoneum TaxID=53361 RepID=A0ABP5TPQ1_9ACTN
MSTQDRAAKESLAFTSYGRPWLIVFRGRFGMAFDRWLVRRTGFSVVSLQYALAGGQRYQPTLLLTTIGAKTGELRSVALPYIRRGDDYVVVASKGGGPVNPAWVANLKATDRCWLRVRRRGIAARARVATGEERAALYPYVVERKPNVARYQERASTFGREIPLVVLSPTKPAPRKGQR